MNHLMDDDILYLGFDKVYPRTDAQLKVITFRSPQYRSPPFIHAQAKERLCIAQLYRELGKLTIEHQLVKLLKPFLYVGYGGFHRSYRSTAIVIIRGAKLSKV
jgi:hypothetical protein